MRGGLGEWYGAIQFCVQLNKVIRNRYSNQGIDIRSRREIIFLMNGRGIIIPNKEYVQIILNNEFLTHYIGSSTLQSKPLEHPLTRVITHANTGHSRPLHRLNPPRESRTLNGSRPWLCICLSLCSEPHGWVQARMALISEGRGGIRGEGWQG